MFRKIFKPQWFTQPFVKNLIANTLGTIIGIALTIGTTYLVTNIEDRKSERQEALNTLHAHQTVHGDLKQG